MYHGNKGCGLAGPTVALFVLVKRAVIIPRFGHVSWQMLLTVGCRVVCELGKAKKLLVECQAGDILWVMNSMRQGIVAAQFWLPQVRWPDVP
jgi:hypothetical protein